MMNALLAAYVLVLFALSLYGLHRYWILFLYWRFYKKAPPLSPPPPPDIWPIVTVQLPIFNERYVAERLVDAVCLLDYPKDKLDIQVLDDSTDDTRHLLRSKVEEKRREGFHIRHLNRKNRDGFKAGALAHGLRSAEGEFAAIFDADFLPPADFLLKTVPHFSRTEIGMVQTRWGHINPDYSLLTRVQSIFLDGHFMLEHTARNRSGAFINFNGTAGIWRKRTIEEAGGWSADTLTEDLDLSYRAQMKGWKFLFLPDVVCPAELPVDMGAFRSQQHRWTKGALQVAKKILPALWRGPFPLLVKLESTAHLTANLAYPLVLMLSLLLFPSLAAREQLNSIVFKWLELGTFLFATTSIIAFYYVAHQETLGQGSRWQWKHVPPLMSFGVGMCLNNTRAVWEALLGIPTEFRRTAKFNVQKKGDAWKGKNYRRKGNHSGFPETLFAAYFLFILVWTCGSPFWWSLPFIGIFFFGYAYVGALTLAHRARSSRLI
jgi:cellulose synthase/poly-beta-1,6-N-acetylglucosamine synthase-like glycosyltransferase